MQTELWYNGFVTKQFVKKSEQIAMKLIPDLLAELEQISRDEDRPLGYVARELMIRGLALYRVDGRLRDEPQAAKHLAPVVATIGPATHAMTKAEIQRTINADEIAEAASRLKPRGRTQKVGVLKGKTG